MDELIHQLEHITGEIVGNIQIADYEDLEQFVDARDQIIGQIRQKAVSDIDLTKWNEKILNILKYDAMITGRMCELKLEAEKQINEIQKKRIQNNAYDSTPYIVRSVFFDSKK